MQNEVFIAIKYYNQGRVLKITVRELIEYLEKCDQDQECYIGANETFYEIDYVDNLYDGFGINIVAGWEKQEEEE